eukprot:2830097-Amphidinium_carterae.1
MADVIVPTVSSNHVEKRDQVVGLRQSFFESYTLALDELRRKHERGDEAPRKGQQCENRWGQCGQADITSEIQIHFALHRSLASACRAVLANKTKDVGEDQKFPCNEALASVLNMPELPWLSQVSTPGENAEARRLHRTTTGSVVDEDKHWVSEGVQGRSGRECEAVVDKRTLQVRSGSSVRYTIEGWHMLLRDS